MAHSVNTQNKKKSKPKVGWVKRSEPTDTFTRKRAMETRFYGSCVPVGHEAFIFQDDSGGVVIPGLTRNPVPGLYGSDGHG
jgi:hypothetical protein